MAAICAAPLVLEEMRLLNGKNCTAHDSVAGKIANVQVSRNVVRDGNLITSRGAGTAIEFALEILSALTDAQTSADIAKSICFNK